MAKKLNIEQRNRIKLKRLLESQQYQCYWCKYKISTKPKEKEYKATVDHLNQKDKPKNSIHNMVAACVYCNNQRHNTMWKPGLRLDLIEKNCKRCGLVISLPKNVKQGKKRKRIKGGKRLCRTCRIANNLNYFRIRV